MLQFPFPRDPSATGYCVFPSELEETDTVFFHATLASNLDEITNRGFKIPDPTGQNGLVSVSFANRSVGALTHAITRRAMMPGEYVIIAVQYESLDRPGLKPNPSDIHDFTLSPAPRLIGYCTIPESYEHR